MTKEFHYAFEILIVLDDAKETFIENEQYLIKNDDIPPGFEHTNKCISTKSIPYFGAYFDVDDLLYI